MSINYHGRVGHRQQWGKWGQILTYGEEMGQSVWLEKDWFDISEEVFLKKVVLEIVGVVDQMCKCWLHVFTPFIYIYRSYYICLMLAWVQIKAYRIAPRCCYL